MRGFPRAKWLETPAFSAAIARSGPMAPGAPMNATQPGTKSGDDHAAHILAIARHRDRTAFAALFRHFAPRVKSYLLRSGLSAMQAEELAQETLLAVWRKAHSFDPARAAVSTWVFTIARNQRIDALRRARKNEVSASDLFAQDGAAFSNAAMAEDADAVQPCDRMDAVGRDRRIREALEELPQEQAAIVRLSFFEDKPHGEIARLLSLPLGTVKSRLRLAMKRLRAALEDFL
jgi:RNA polymerase sigma-70 factor (ECF subfamily)